MANILNENISEEYKYIQHLLWYFFLKLKSTV